MKSLVLLLLVLLFSFPPFGGAATVIKAPVPRLEVKTTISGTSVITPLRDPNLIYAMIPEALLLAGVTDEWVRRNMGDAAFAGVTGWYLDPDTGLLTHHEITEIPIELHAGIYSIALASATTNYNTHSELFSDAAWSKQRTGVTPGAIDPMGTTKAFRFGEDQSVETTHYIRQTINEAVFADNAIVTFSVYAKADSRTWLVLVPQTKDASTVVANFNLTNGTVGVTSGASSAAISRSINGFYRISVTYMIESAANNPIFDIRIGEADNDSSYTGDGVSGLTIFGAMVSESPSAHPYLPTEGSAYVWAGNAGALTYSLATMETALDNTVTGTVDSGTSIWGIQLGTEISAGALTVGNLYFITDEEGGHWFPGSGLSGASYFVEASGTTTADANNKVQRVLNAWDSGDGHGLEPPGGTMITAVRFTYDYLSIPGGTSGLVGLTTGGIGNSLLSTGFTAGYLKSRDGPSDASLVSVNWSPNRWWWFVVEFGRLNSNVSQFRLCRLNNGLSCGSWTDYSGSYADNSGAFNYFVNGFGYVHFGPLLIYRTHLDSTFYDALGNGG